MRNHFNEISHMSHVDMHPRILTAQYDAGNVRFHRERRALAKSYYPKLCEVLRAIIVEGVHPFHLSEFCAKAIRYGAPIDGGVLTADEKVLAMEARFTALCISRLSNLWSDCRGYLAHRLRKPPEKIEGSIAWNLCCAGESINPGGG